MILVDTSVLVDYFKENNLVLLHNDRDFDAIAEKTPDLKILERY